MVDIFRRKSLTPVPLSIFRRKSLTPVPLSIFRRKPLTPVPLSLCYCDGTMAKTEKTALFRHLESKVERSFPSSAYVDGCEVDGSILLRVLPPNLPTTYGRLAATILIQATALSNKHVDIIFDTYEMPSIKAMERERRGTTIS